MPRSHVPAASTLRNRNRITNKTRLKIHQGSLDADATSFIPDEDEEKHRLTNLVAGVDAEDANEHHLQEVLSAVHRNNVNRQSRGSSDKQAPPPSAFIPTPDSTGVTANADELYPSGKWKDPVTYVYTSQTVEESIAGGIANGFTYYMDERDKEWLDKNNEEGRGEGTSAQGAVSVSSPRTSRSAKAKGKEPEASQPVVISEDEFELVMGVFEKVTHDRTEFLHHGLENGMEFPPFSDYQDVFSSSLPTSMFTTFSVPTWVPLPAVLLKMAKVVYPYWKERRLERAGYQIIPAVNGDESDTLNESYVCFRRREVKAVRKTRASQSSSSDKLARLQVELNYPLELAKAVIARENLKKEAATQSQAVWEKRMAFADLKRKFPALTDKDDESLLVDKERPVKKPEIARIPGLRIKTSDATPAARQEPIIRPHERQAHIREEIDRLIDKQKALDHHWEDQIDNPYQNGSPQYASKLFQYIAPLGAPRSSSGSDRTDDEQAPSTRHARAVRMRYGRGGRIHLDRRESAPRTFASVIPRSSLFALNGDDGMDVDGDSEDIDGCQRLAERWRFDMDDTPAVTPQGSDEQDRVLVDDYDTTYLRHAMTVPLETDHMHLVTDPTVIIPGADGRPQGVVPYRLGMPPPMMRRDAQGIPRPFQPGVNGLQPIFPLQMHAMLAAQQQMNKMQPPAGAPQMRISSNGGMRPPSTPVSNLQQAAQPVVQPPQPKVATAVSVPQQPVPVPVPQHSPSNGVSGVSRAAISMPHVDTQKPEAINTSAIPTSMVNGMVTAISHPEVNTEASVNGTPTRPKSQNVTPQQHVALGVPTNGYHMSQMTNMAAIALLNQAAYQSGHPGSLSVQQMQNLKSAFANLSAAEMAALNGRALPVPYSMPNGGAVNLQQLPAGANLNLKLPVARHLQWTMSAQTQRPGPTVNSMEGQMHGVIPNGMVTGANIAQAIPSRSPSANGARPMLRNSIHINGQQPMSPHTQQTSALPNISQSQSPPRVAIPPNLAMTSPSLKQQQPVGN